MEDRSSTRFDLLNEENYFTWKYRMEMHLIRKDLWGIVSGTEPRPASGVRTQLVWDKRARLAAAEIILHVSDSQLPLTRKTTDPVQMWQILKEYHESSGWANRMTVLRRFVSLKMEEGAPIQEHINDFNKLDQSLKDIGITLTDMLRMTILLASLPPTYENIVTAIESYIEANTDPSDPTHGPDFDYVTRRLLNEERRRKLNSPENDAALVVRSFKGRHADPANITCYGCGQKGHYRNKCPNLASGGESPTKANVAVEEDIDYAF